MQLKICQVSLGAKKGLLFMVIKTPPMGWNSWNTFAENINEQLIRDTADKMVEEGLLDCGYNYLVIDDCWALKERDENGKLVANPDKFPNGMKAVADYVHSKGLKFGMYSCAGMLTCAGYPSSYDHEFIDAATFAEWGVDYLKYDYCYKPGSVDGDVLYKRMGLALANCGRDILYSACSWGEDETKKWIKSTGANMWRSTGDIQDSWESIKKLSMEAPQSIKYSAMNCFFDMDMLVVGMYGKGHVGLAACNDEEYKLHFSLWALLGTPLMIGCDIRNMNDAPRAILKNKDVIAINQDPACNQPFIMNDCHVPKNRHDDEFRTEIPIYAKMLDNGDVAIGVFNFANTKPWEPLTSIKLDMLGLSESTGKTLLLKDLWSGEEFKVTNGTVMISIEPHSCRLFRGKVIDK